MRKATVTQLVDFSKCEKLGVLKLERSEELGEARRRAVDQGVRAHGKLERAASVDGRCFVATFAYGADAPQTQALRGYRDRRLMATRVGRVAIRAYYALSPWAVATLARVPGGRAIARWCVDGALWALKATQGGGRP